MIEKYSLAKGEVKMLTKIGDVLEKLILAVVALLMGVMIVATVIAVCLLYTSRCV